MKNYYRSLGMKVLQCCNARFSEVCERFDISVKGVKRTFKMCNNFDVKSVHPFTMTPNS
jgi:hypothetical protein